MEYLKIFSCCFIVKGQNHFVIIDPQRNEYYRLPNKYYEFIEFINNNPRASALDKLESIDDYKEFEIFLIDNELAFFTENPNNFIEIDEQFEEPFLINNAILDYDKNSRYNLKNALEQIDKLNCPFVQLRFYKKIQEEELIDLIQFLENLPHLMSFEIICEFNDEIDLVNLKKLSKNVLKLQALIFFSANKTVLLNSCIVNNQSMQMIILVEDFIRDENDCGKIGSEYFVTNNMYFILESKNYNNCLNKKISIDKKGLVRNCPSMKTDFGHIENIFLETIIENIEFQKYWSISKDKVSVCKSCEFRLICSDCRAYTEGNDLFGKPKKCTYDPIN